MTDVLESDQHPRSVSTPGSALRERSRTVRLPSRAAEYDARRRLLDLWVTPGEMGDLAETAVWWSGVAGSSPAPLPKSPHAIVLGGDHGIAVRGVSAHPLGWTAEAVARVGAPDGPVRGTADALGITVEVVAVDVAGPEGPGSRAFDREPALRADQVDAAFGQGISLVAAATSAGHDVLVLSCLGVGSSTTAAALAASALGRGFVSLVGRGSGIDDLAWMRKAGALRDGLRRARLAGVTPASPAVTHLTHFGSLDAAVAVGILVEAAARRVPVVIDGPLAAAAALLAQRISPSSRHWWLAIDGLDEPVAAQVWDEIAVARLWVGASGSGLGGMVAVAMVRTAAALLASVTSAETGATPDP